MALETEHFPMDPDSIPSVNSFGDPISLSEREKLLEFSKPNTPHSPILLAVSENAYKLTKEPVFEQNLRSHYSPKYSHGLILFPLLRFSELRIRSIPEIT